MNWNTIKEKCPKAFEKYKEWLEDPVKINDLGWLGWEEELPTFRFVNERYSFDFFDEQGIFIEVQPYLSEEQPEKWGWDIIMGDSKLSINADDRFYDYDCLKRSITRTESETEAFSKAFEILEKQLERK